MRIKLSHKGDYKKTIGFLGDIKERRYLDMLDKYGQIGVSELIKYTPVDSGLTASSWYYTIESSKDGNLKLSFHNSNINDGVSIAIILQYGHGTGTGGWVEGTDYINPALTPVFDKLVEDMWRRLKIKA